MSPRKFDDFDHFANDYRNIHNNNIKLSGVQSDYFSEHKIQTLKKYEKKDNINFLDFGCGDGNSAIYFTKHFPDGNYIGVDISKDSIDVAQSKNCKNCNFTTFDGETLPFEDNSFDIVFTACVFHHIEFKLHENLMKEIQRVLKKGGRFYIFEHNPWNPITQRMVNTCPFDKDAILLKPTYLQKLILKIFNNQETNFILFFPRHKLFQIFIKFEKYLKKIPLGGQYFVRAIK
jgi:ubiquinone/menaquinone biosynthesis C-methylase UbiE